MLNPVISSVPASDRHLTGREKVTYLSRFARSVLARSCSLNGFRLDSLPKDPKGVPLPVNGVHWSLTHKGDAVGAVAAPLPVGIDLEILRPVNPSLFAKVADEKEWERVGARRLNHFFRLWTAKEAILKAVGRGISGLSHCKVLRIEDPTHMELVYDGTCWTIEHFWFRGHVAALTAYDFTVQWNRMA